MSEKKHSPFSDSGYKSNPYNLYAQIQNRITCWML